MFVVCDIEANRLDNPDKIHCVVIREVDNPEKVHVFENVHEDSRALLAFANTVSCWIGHYFLSFDISVLKSLGVKIDSERVIDTLVVSRLLNFGISGGHSLEAWGERLGESKIGLDITDWTCYTKDILKRCIQDTKVNLKLYNYFKKYINNKQFKNSLRLEHNIQSICLSIKTDGFAFNKEKALNLQSNINTKLKTIDDNLLLSFPPKKTLVAEITPRYTKQGAIHATDYRRLMAAGYSEGEIVNGEECYGIWEEVPFNPGSIKQTIDRLWEAGWKPTEKTKGHIELYKRSRGRGVRVGSDDKAHRFERYGWKLSEENLRTLPDSAPEATRALTERLLLASRVSDLEEWLNLCREHPDGYNRIHGSFDGIGSWTHRLASNKPNMQNIPVAKHSDKETPIEVLANSINDVMRSLWIVPKGRRLLGVDADGIQMRIFAHYVNDPKLIEALIKGKKSDATDIHSVHRSALGNACASRDLAKTFIYAWILGAGTGKVAEIFGCTASTAKTSIKQFIDFYPGLKELKQGRIPQDVDRGYFIGLDGRYVIAPDEHRVLAGYLQNGEAVVMKRACVDWQGTLKKDGIDFKLVTWPHDEWQTEVDDDDRIAEYVCKVQMDAIVKQGVELGLNCPLGATASRRPDGFYGGYSWKETH